MNYKNHVLGKGELYLANHRPGTFLPGPERYVANTLEYNINVSYESIDHFDSDHGVNEVDDTAHVSVDRSGTFTTQNINPYNLGLFLGGEAQKITTQSAVAASEVVTGVEAGMHYQIGTSPSTPQGVRGISNVSVMSDTTPLVEGVDFRCDAALQELGRVEILSADNVTNGTITITYDVAESTREMTISGNKSIECSSRFISFNTSGNQQDFLCPRVRITPDGDFNLKTGEWQQLGFTTKILKVPGMEAVYCDGRPFDLIGA